MTHRIRPATLADIPAMVRLEQISFPGDRLSVRSLRRLVREGRAICLVAEVEEHVVGDAVVLLRRGSRSARLYSVAVDPARRKAGIGTALMAEAERLAVSSGRDVMRLEVREDNVAAHRRYLATGYVTVGSKPGFYDDGAAAISMKKRLAGLPV
ncbi:N-acetyltransferase [Emcibacter sp. SYSU 3D8]|uniref:GNAT family N-acetyltransferase n=1 Tax=Emcibacter sp. SYSU 3D8 TaxID=3133969 RepID=UPI0031FECA6C